MYGAFRVYAKKGVWSRWRAAQAFITLIYVIIVYEKKLTICENTILVVISMLAAALATKNRHCRLE